MKKLLLLIGLVVLVSGSVFGDATSRMEKSKQDLVRQGWNEGDPNQNQILEATEDYIIIRNLTAKSSLYYSFIERNIPAKIFEIEAEMHCANNNFFNKIYYKSQVALDEHTVYFKCDAQTSEKLPKTENSETMFLGMCLDAKGYENFYKELKCSKKIKKYLKKWPQAKQYSEKIKAHTKKFQDDAFIFELKKKVFAKANTQKTIDSQQKKIETCQAYGFEKGSEPFGQCIFKLMELELEYAKLENEAMRLQAQAQQAELNNQAALAQSLAAQAQAANRDKGLRLQQFGLAMQGIANAFQTPSSMANPKITCQNIGMQMKCW